MPMSLGWSIMTVCRAENRLAALTSSGHASWHRVVSDWVVSQLKTACLISVKPPATKPASGFSACTSASTARLRWPWRRGNLSVYRALANAVNMLISWMVAGHRSVAGPRVPPLSVIRKSLAFQNMLSDRFAC
jgi:hypothetical protein